MTNLKWFHFLPSQHVTSCWATVLYPSSISFYIYSIFVYSLIKEMPIKNELIFFFSEHPIFFLWFLFWLEGNSTRTRIIIIFNYFLLTASIHMQFLSYAMIIDKFVTDSFFFVIKKWVFYLYYYFIIITDKRKLIFMRMRSIPKCVIKFEWHHAK